MPNIQPYNHQSLLIPLSAIDGRLARQTSRQIAAINQAVDVNRAAIAAAADIQQEKVDAVARTGGYAMQQAALVSNMQQQLALAAPASSGDLDYLKTLTMMGIGQIVTDTARQVNR